MSFTYSQSTNQSIYVLPFIFVFLLTYLYMLCHLYMSIIYIAFVFCLPIFCHLSIYLPNHIFYGLICFSSIFRTPVGVLHSCKCIWMCGLGFLWSQVHMPCLVTRLPGIASSLDPFCCTWGSLSCNQVPSTSSSLSCDMFQKIILKTGSSTVYWRKVHRASLADGRCPPPFLLSSSSCSPC